MPAAVLLHSSPPKKGFCIAFVFCFFLFFSTAAVFSGFTAFQCSGPRHMARGKQAGARAGSAADRAVMFWRPRSPLSRTRDKTRQTDGKGMLPSEDAFNFHKDDFVS